MFSASAFAAFALNATQVPPDVPVLAMLPLLQDVLG